MKKKLLITVLLSLAFGPVASAQSASTGADPTVATDDAYSMSVYYAARQFNMIPAIDGVDGTGAKIEFLIPVTKGLDYVFLAGRDRYIQDLDIYVYDEGNSLIKGDRRPDKRAGVRFNASYNGTVKVILHVARADGLGAWSVIVGRRGGSGIQVLAPGSNIPDNSPPEEEAPAE